MKYRSTRGMETERTGAQAILEGIAPDKGLYVPTSFPSLPLSFDALSRMKFADISDAVLTEFFDDYTPEEIRACVDHAYDEKFEDPAIVPMKKAGGVWFLELYHGRTAAFKDIALSILPYLLTTAMRKEKIDDKICILTATSGDTGKAALEGFADVPGTEIIVFFPNAGVSEIQERQMITQQGANVHVFAVNGNFDDAQTGVKTIFHDASFAKELSAGHIRLSSANSINIGRLIPQIAYYVYGYAQLIAKGEIQAGDPVNIVVPTGNFGNILAAYYAKQMGIPARKLICASNKNRILTDFLETGVYDTHRPFYQTNSPSMDILISSNLERLLYHLSGGRSEEICRLMGALEKDGRYEISERIREGLADFVGGTCGVEETNRTIGEMYRNEHYLIDTHTAVAYKVYQDYRAKTGDDMPTLLASTASAYKFAGSVSDAIGLPKPADGFRAIEEVYRETGVPIPHAMDGLEAKPILHNSIIDVPAMKDSVRSALLGK